MLLVGSMSAEDLLCARRPLCVCCEPAVGTPGMRPSPATPLPLASQASPAAPFRPGFAGLAPRTDSLHEAALVLGWLGPGRAAPRQGSQRHPVPSTGRAASSGSPPGVSRAGERGQARGAVDHRPARGTLSAINTAASVRRRQPPVPIATAVTTRWPPGPQNLPPAGPSARVGPRAQ